MASKHFESTPMLYGSEIVDQFIPKALTETRILRCPPFTPDFLNLNAQFHKVLQNPLGMDMPFQRLVSNVYAFGEKISIIVDDQTRPNFHTRLLLPIVLQELKVCKVGTEDINLLVATGTHRAPTEEELEKIILAPSIYDQWRKQILIHNCDENCNFIGETSQKTPIYINKNVLDSCLVILLTDSEYHFFAGQAGTIKSFCPGVVGRETIRRNHPKMFDINRGFKPECRCGNTVKNPVIQEIREIVKLVKSEISTFGIDTIVNNNEIVYLNAGDPLSLHDAASGPLKQLRIMEVNKPADLVFVSPGSHGLDLYQACKGAHAGWHAVRKDGKGWIVVLAPCKSGVGNESFSHAMHDCKDKPLKEALRYVLDTYCTEETFQIGNQVPVDILRILLTVGEDNIKFLTEMAPKKLKYIFRIDAIPRLKGESLQETLRRTVLEYQKVNPNPRIYILHDAGSLVKVN